MYDRFNDRNSSQGYNEDSAPKHLRAGSRESKIDRALLSLEKAVAEHNGLLGELAESLHPVLMPPPPQDDAGSRSNEITGPSSIIAETIEARTSEIVRASGHLRHLLSRIEL